MEYAMRKLAENKLIILYLVQKMGISLSNSEICQFLLTKDYIDYFTAQEYLAELVDAAWLEKMKERNHTRYVLTEDGEDVINYFEHHIATSIKEEITEYANENNKRIRAEYAVTAHYFPESNGDYLVKCSLCDDSGSILMEISAAVVSREQAQQACKNWRKNVSTMYGSFLTTLVSSESNKKKSEGNTKPEDATV